MQYCNIFIQCPQFVEQLHENAKSIDFLNLNAVTSKDFLLIKRQYHFAQVRHTDKLDLGNSPISKLPSMMPIK